MLLGNNTELTKFARATNQPLREIYCWAHGTFFCFGIGTLLFFHAYLHYYFAETICSELFQSLAWGEINCTA